MSFRVPVLFLNYNRPDLTALALKSISSIKPTHLYISCDGPNMNKKDDLLKTNKVREITKNIDWECNVKYNFFDENKGCKVAVSAAINWFFDHVDQGIILEDDIICDKGFFEFASEMLDKYQHNKQVMHISGNCFIETALAGDKEIYFSAVPHIWGWATWKRAWQKYDIQMNDFDKNRDYDHITSRKLKDHHIKAFERAAGNEVDTWDYQWGYTIWKNSGLCVTPPINLIKNIGFDEFATHTKQINPRISSLKIGVLKKPYLLPKKLEIDQKKDELLYVEHIEGEIATSNIFTRLFKKFT